MTNGSAITVEQNDEGTWDIILTLPPDYSHFTPMGGSGFTSEDEAYNALERLEVRPKPEAPFSVQDLTAELDAIERETPPEGEVPRAEWMARIGHISNRLRKLSEETSDEQMRTWTGEQKLRVRRILALPGEVDR